MSERPIIAVSACLAGKAVRYDGGHRLDPYLVNTWGRHVELVQVCPEAGAGLPVPREQMVLTGGGLRLLGRESGRDYTAEVGSWCVSLAGELEALDPWGFILKSRSPSCSGDEAAEGGIAAGILRRVLAERMPLVPVADDKTLQNPDGRALFLESMFTLRRWRQAKRSGVGRESLIRFHTAGKLALLAHSLRGYRELGRIVANPLRRGIEARFAEYEAGLLEILRHHATTARQAEMLHHAAGHLRGALSVDQMGELAEAIEGYRGGVLAIAVPITLISHHAKKTNNPFLKAQTLLNPDPLEIKLRG